MQRQSINITMTQIKDSCPSEVNYFSLRKLYTIFIKAVTVSGLIRFGEFLYEL